MHAADVLDVSWQAQISKMQMLGFPWESLRAQIMPQQIAVTAQLSCFYLQAFCASCLWDARGTQFSSWGRQVQGRPPCTCSFGTGRFTMVLWPAWQRMSAAACSSTRRCGASIAAHSGLHLAAVAVRAAARPHLCEACDGQSCSTGGSNAGSVQRATPFAAQQLPRLMMVMSKARGTCTSSMIFKSLH